ncbi:MAG TPA: urea ABC transporter ATP-binding protein UrtD [Polyangiaceae bacterium]|nr:urea ABC transporter ATP-binding protein UrtD [Polyangiaceae bacterium]
MTALESARALESVSLATPETEAPPPPETKPEAEKPAKRRSIPSLAPRRRTVDKSRYEALTAGRKALLCVDAVTVSFDGFKALDNLTLVLDEGELRCIIGPNGAGKTTLQDVITGKTKPDQGCVFMVGDDTDLTHLDEHEIAQRGICRKFQRPTVFQGHTVFENLELALPGNKGVFASLFARLARKERERIEETLELIGLQDHARTRAGLLSHGQKQWLEIGMLLAQQPRVLLVDEPVAGMTHKETERTAELLNALAGERTVVVVEHDMEFVRSIARTVTVLHEGRVLAEGPMDTVQNDPKVIEVYLGES